MIRIKDTMIFETHAHYDDARFDEDRKELLASLPDMNIGCVVNASAEFSGLASSQKLAHSYEHVYFTSGIHPSEIKGLSLDHLKAVEEYACDEKCLAIGEIGLDYYWEKDPDARNDQREWFLAQLDIAKKLDMPVVVHSREACEDTLEILKDTAKDGIICDIHCFSYSPEIATEYVRMGFFLGIGGVVTYKNSKKLKESVEAVPLESILLETDCPYLTPHPFRGMRNDSTYLPYVVKAIADIKCVMEEEVIEVTSQNAKRFYRL